MGDADVAHRGEGGRGGGVISRKRRKDEEKAQSGYTFFASFLFSSRLCVKIFPVTELKKWTLSIASRSHTSLSNAARKSAGARAINLFDPMERNTNVSFPINSVT